MCPAAFSILIPRLLPALYEIRNNRGVGHTGGDVDPNHMDATAVLSIASWILAEFVRVFHGVSVQQAQAIVDAIVDRPIPLVWQGGAVKRVLDTKMKYPDQILLLLHVTAGPVAEGALIAWLDSKDFKYFRKLLRALHSKRFIEFDESRQTAEILPPGTAHITAILKRKLKALL